MANKKMTVTTGFGPYVETMLSAHVQRKWPRTWPNGQNMHSFIGNHGHCIMWQCHNFKLKLTSSCFCQSTMKIWLKLAKMLPYYQNYS